MDFAVYLDEVFFCGIRKDKTTITGVWGRFNIYDLKTSNLTYEIYDNFMCNKHMVDTLHRIAVYLDSLSGLIHIVTVGTTNDGTTTNGCTIDITPNTSGSTAWNYTIGVTPDITGERINRICLTDNLVVTAGPAIMCSDFDVYRIHDKYNLFPAGGPQDEIWHFPLSSVHRYKHNAENYEITHIKNDTVAIAIQTMDLDPPNPLGILVTAYDMGSLYNGALNTQYSHYKESIGKLNVQGLKYNNATRRLILLFNDSVVSTVAEIPLSSLNVTLNSLSTHLLISLDLYNLYNGQQNFLCQGIDLSQPFVTTYFTQPINGVSICAIPSTIRATEPDFITKWDPAPYTVCEMKFDCTTLCQINTFIIDNEMVCSDRHTITHQK